MIEVNEKIVVYEIDCEWCRDHSAEDDKCPFCGGEWYDSMDTIFAANGVKWFKTEFSGSTYKAFTDLSGSKREAFIKSWSPNLVKCDELQQKD